MLLRSANAVGYINYSNIIIHKFCKQASKYSVYVFRIFDYLNYTENLNIGVDAAGSASGFVEGTLSYTGGVSEPNKGKYDLEYNINLTRDITDMGIHYLAVKNMAGLLTPCASTMLVLVLGEYLPVIPLHMTLPG